MLIDMFGNSKIDSAIRILRENEPDDEPYYGATSGGKDSIVIMKLAEMAGVNVEWYCNLTTVDPPELIRFLRRNYPHVKLNRPKMNMWQLIVKKRMPPTRLVRYCCDYLKEGGGAGRIVITGVRRSESYKRSKRQAVEQCWKRSGKTYVNPIIDWTTQDVWDFIKKNSLPHCSLYDEGFKRLGCIGCPIGGPTGMKKDFDRWPHFKKLYIKAFGKMLENRIHDGLMTEWTSAEAVFDWWTTKISKEKKDDSQIKMFE